MSWPDDVVEAAAHESRLAAYARQVLRRGLFLFAPAVVLLCVSAPLLLTLFGSDYASTGADTLRLFAVAVLPKLVLTVFVAAARVQERVGTRHTVDVAVPDQGRLLSISRQSYSSSSGARNRASSAASAGAA